MTGYDEWKTGNYGEDYFPDEKPVYTCDICEEGIYEGEKYLDLGNQKVCERCIDRCECIA